MMHIRIESMLHLLYHNIYETNTFLMFAFMLGRIAIETYLIFGTFP